MQEWHKSNFLSLGIWV